MSKQQKSLSQTQYVATSFFFGLYHLLRVLQRSFLPALMTDASELKPPSRSTVQSSANKDNSLGGDIDCPFHMQVSKNILHRQPPITDRFLTPSKTRRVVLVMETMPAADAEHIASAYLSCTWLARSTRFPGPELFSDLAGITIPIFFFLYFQLLDDARERESQKIRHPSFVGPR